MYNFNIDDFREYIEQLMQKEYKTLENATKNSYEFSQKIYPKAEQYLRKKYGYLVDISDTKNSVKFTKDVQNACTNTINDIIRKYS